MARDLARSDVVSRDPTGLTISSQNIFTMFNIRAAPLIVTHAILFLNDNDSAMSISTVFTS